MATKPETSTVSEVMSFAGMTLLKVNVTYPGEQTQTVYFSGVVGSENGTVFMGDFRVSDPERFGPFGKEWVKNFFA